MDLSFTEVSKYVTLENAFNDIGMESLSSDSIKINSKIYRDLLNLEVEYNRAIRDGDYQKAIGVCDAMMDALNDANNKLKSLAPETRSEGLRIFAYVMVIIAGIVSLGAAPFIMDSVGNAFFNFVKKIAGGTAARAAGSIGAIGSGIASFAGGTAMTFKGYFELLKHAYAPSKKEFAGDSHADNVNYRLAAGGIQEAKEIVMNLRNNTVAYLNDMNRKANESDISILMECAFESIDLIDGEYEGDAMESLSSDSKKAQKEFMKKAREIYKNLNIAYQSRDYDATVKHLDELEALTKEYEDKLDAMKADGKIGKAFGGIAKLAILALAIVAFIKPGTFSMPITNVIGKIVKAITGGTSAATARIASSATTMAGSLTAGTIGFNTIYTAIRNALKARKAKREHPDDPRYANGDYAAAKEIVEEIRGLLARARIEVMSMKRNPTLN